MADERKGRGDKGTSREPEGVAEAVLLLPDGGRPAPTEAELATLVGIGRHWGRALGGRLVDPGPLRTGSDLVIRAHRAERLVTAVSTAFDERIYEPVDVPSWLWSRGRRLLVGPPLATSALVDEKLTKLKALAILSSDALSSVAYGTEAMVSVLILAGSGALGLSLPLAAGIVTLMLVVGISYRQTIRAYPRGGGSYIVAKDNLGQTAGLLAAAGLSTDYVLTVAVSVSAGAAAITSALPPLRGQELPLTLALIGVVLFVNLRGLRQSSTLFALPTYLFVVSMLVLIGAGLFQAAGRGWAQLPTPAVAPVEGLALFVVLRAFASGSSAMTGVEAIADGVPAFRQVEWRNARTTLTWMIALLVVMFAGVTFLVNLDGLIPRPDETLLSQLAAAVLGRGWAYGAVQATTAAILVLAANTAFSDFPRLLYFLARDRFVPLTFLRMGDRLGHSNGILALAAVAAVLVVAFNARTDALIALYAVGVFLSFTLSQAGMMVRWLRRREPGWRRGLPINAIGAFVSAVVLTVVVTAKFLAGAWIVIVLAVALLAAFRRVHRHYACAEAATVPHALSPDAVRIFPEAHPIHGPAPAELETAEAPDELEHLVVVPVTTLNLPALRALAYASSLGKPVLAVHISPDERDAERVRSQWEAWGGHVRLEVVMSPYRLVVLPLTNYVRGLRRSLPGTTLTVVLPEIAVPHWWQNALHNQVPLKLRVPLRQMTGVVVTSVPFHLPRDC